MTPPRTQVGVLVSGSGTNLQALLDATRQPDHPAAIAMVVSDRPRAYGLTRARDAGVPTAVVLKRDHPDRAAYDARVVELLQEAECRWVCLAGFMRLITPTFLRAFPNRVLNIHPALLPAFPGLHGQQQALDAGVRVTGATVHIVDEGTDTGPIVAQGAVPVEPDDDLETLRSRILRMEHQLYPRVLRWAVEGRLTVHQGRVLADLPPGEHTFRFDPRP